MVSYSYFEQVFLEFIYFFLACLLKINIKAQKESLIGNNS